MSFCIKVLFLLIFQRFPTSHAVYRIGEGIDPCLELHKSFENLEQALTCCEAMKKAFEPIFEFETCLGIEPEIWSCRKFRCLLEAGPGILIKKKDVDPKKGLEMLVKITGKYPEIADMTKKLGHECFVKNLTRFYNYVPECPSMNVMYCLVLHSFADCPSWSNSEECRTLAAGSKLCKPRMDEYDQISERLHTAVPSTTTELAPEPYEIDPTLKSCGAVTKTYRNLELSKKCCPAMQTIFEPIFETVECLDIEPRKWSCKKFKCLLTLGSDPLMKGGEIDLKQGRQMLKKISTTSPELTQLTELLDHECFVKNVSKFYSIDDCPAMNLIYCFASNMLAYCPQWKDDKICEQLAKPAKNCKEFLDLYRKISDHIHFGRFTTTTLSPDLTVPTELPNFETCDSINTNYNLLEQTKKCCNGMMKVFELIEDNRDCLAVTPGKWSCKKIRCFLKSPIPDLLINDQLVNMTKARKLLQKFTEQHPDMERMARMIEHECIDKNASRYYPVEEKCPALSFHNCWAINSFTECPSWSKADECRHSRVWGKKCHDIMEQVRRETDSLEHGYLATEFTIIYPDKLTSPMPKSILCSELISDYSYVSAAYYCCYPMRNIFVKTFHLDKDCLNYTPGRLSCKKSRCLLGEIPNLLFDDWFINEKKAKELLEEIASKYPKTEAMTKMMHRECVEKNVTHFYPVEECPALNFMYCFLLNSFTECTEWNPDEHCEKIMRKARQCKKALDKVRTVTDDLHAKSSSKKEPDTATEGGTGRVTGATVPEHTTDSGGVTDERGATVTGSVTGTDDDTETGRVTGTGGVTATRRVTPVDFSKPKCADLHADYGNVELAKYCCDAMEKVLQPLSVNEGCLVFSPREWSCDKVQCLLSAVKGLLVKGNINTEVGHEMLEKITKKHPELEPMTKIMDRECFVKNVTQFYPMESCPANSLMYCLVVNSFAECPVWNEGGGCKEVVESAKKCKRTITEVRGASDVIHESEKTRPTKATTEMRTTTRRKPKDHRGLSCSKLIQSYETLELVKECCSLMKKVFEPLDSLEYCFDMEPEKWTCGKFRCFMSGVPGLLINYRDVNPEAGRAMLKEITNKYPEVATITKLVERECFVKNVSINYPVDSCKPIQYIYCMAVNSFSECTTWSDRPECEPFIKMSQDCRMYMEADRNLTDIIYENQFTTTTVEEETSTQKTTAVPESALCSDLAAEYEKLTLGVQCCKAIDILFEPLTTSEVCTIMADEWSCGKARCYLYSIPNMLLKNKQVNYTVGHEIMRQLAEKHPDMAHMTKIIDHECFVKDANKFYNINSKCPLLNVVYCMLINSFAECPSWSDESKCQAIKESSQQCNKVLVREREKTDNIFFKKETEARDEEPTTSTRLTIPTMPRIITIATTKRKPNDAILCPDISTQFENLDAAKRCCDPMMKLFEPFFSNEACLDIAPDKWTCKKSRCFLEAAGLLIESRFVNEAAGQELLQNLAKKHSEVAPMAQIIERECFVKNASRFYPINTKCPAQNVMMCITVNSFAECSPWSNRPDCQPVKDSSKRCKKVMDPIREKTDKIHGGSKTTTKKPTTKEKTTKKKNDNVNAIMCSEIATEFKYFTAAKHCCEPISKLFEPFTDNDCNDIAPWGWSCGKARCFLSKAGLLIKARFLNGPAGQELMKELGEKHQELAPMTNIIERECFIKNSTRFYPLDAKCPPHNLIYCMIVNSFSECPSWSQEPDCKSVVHLSKQCKRKLDIVREKTDKMFTSTTATPATATTTPTPVTPVDFTKPQCPELHASYDAFDLAKTCCVAIENIFEEVITTNKICLLLNSKNWACDKFDCLFSSAKLLDRQRNKFNLNVDAGRMWLQRVSQKYPDLASMIKIMDQECFVKNVTWFYPLNGCDSSSLMYCLAVNSYAECPKWNDNDKRCHSVIEQSKKCKRSLDYARNESDFIYQDRMRTSTTPLNTSPVKTTKTYDSNLYCEQVMQPEKLSLAKECCIPMKKILQFLDEYEYCLDLHPNTWLSCVKIKCMMMAIPGLVIESNNTVNLDVGKEVLTRQGKKLPELESMTNYMIHECFEKNYSRFYDTNKCQLVNNFHCLVVNGFAECPSWSDEHKCKSIKELSQKCHRKLSAYRKLTDEIVAHELTEIKPDRTAACDVLHESIKDLEQTKDCCDAMKKVFVPFENKACADIEPLGQWSCKRMKCLVQTYEGLLDKNWQVNATIGHEIMDKLNKQHPDLESFIKRLDNECFKTELFGKTCSAFTLMHCLSLNSFVDCPSWKDSAECKPYEEKAKECKAALEEKRQKLFLRQNAGTALKIHQPCVVVVTLYFAFTI